jgi:predicted  nucleic acid-binding Zn-ribbon protein
MDKRGTIAKIDKLRDELIRLQGEDNASIKTIAHLNARREGIRRRRKEIHEEIETLKGEVLKSGLCIS